MSTEKNAYILGTEQAELNRLGLQHQVWASEAQLGWENAGFTRGMTILDLGSGPGFCTRELAKIVGTEGKVLAVDKSKLYIDYMEEINSTQQLPIQTVHKNFDELDLSSDSLDGMYCRWALAWIPNPKEIMTNVYEALKPGGKVVLHEYYHWMTHQINPQKPLVQKAIGMCYKSFQDTEGNIDIGNELPAILDEIGFSNIKIRTMSKMANPKQLAWQWPRSFYEVYWPKLVAMGYLTDSELETAYADLAELEKNPGTTLLCPLLVEVVAEKPYQS